MMFELETKIDGNDKVRHAQIKIDYFMSASTKPFRLLDERLPFLISVSFSHFKSPHGWRLDLILRARRLKCGFYGALTFFRYWHQTITTKIQVETYE
jgi:hypothetical protein